MPTAIETHITASRRSAMFGGFGAILASAGSLALATAAEKEDALAIDFDRKATPADWADLKFEDVGADVEDLPDRASFIEWAANDWTILVLAAATLRKNDAEMCELSSVVGEEAAIELVEALDGRAKRYKAWAELYSAARTRTMCGMARYYRDAGVELQA